MRGQRSNRAQAKIDQQLGTIQTLEVRGGLGVRESQRTTAQTFHLFFQSPVLSQDPLGSHWPQRRGTRERNN